ncbi:MAG TPA: RidA family protein [Thermoplasmata archaeon]|nr:RidA family protein [Thermoplasmata archaeon]
MLAAKRLQELGLSLPPPPKPAASYVPLVLSGNLAYVSGIVPHVEGRPDCAGLAGRDATTEQANAAAKRAALLALSVLQENGLLDRVRRVVRVTGFVASAPGYIDQPKVINGASDLLVAVFGEAGKHARSAVGVAALPLNSTVEVEFLFEVA